MSGSRRQPVLALLAAAALALALVACNDDATHPSDGAPEPTMANLWPHADSTGWTYDMTVDYYGAPALAAAPPPLPSFEAMHAALAQAPGAAPDSNLAGEYRLHFEGDITTGSGVTAQHLVDTFAEGSRLTRGAGDGQARLLRALAAAHPGDRALAAALARLPGGRDKLFEVSPAPMFMSSYAFAAEDSGYYTYGDLGRSHSWVFLEGDLEPGAEFSLQLVPMLMDDLWLRARIWSVRDRTLDGRRWRNVVEVFYVVDMGEQAITGENGDLLGYLRNYTYGTVLYVPEVGPIACDEQHVFGPPQIYQTATGGGINVVRCRYTGTITP